MKASLAPELSSVRESSAFPETHTPFSENCQVMLIVIEGLLQSNSKYDIKKKFPRDVSVLAKWDQTGNQWVNWNNWLLWDCTVYMNCFKNKSVYKLPIKCTIQWLLVYSQCCLGITMINFRTLSSLQKETPIWGEEEVLEMRVVIVCTILWMSNIVSPSELYT